MVEMMKNQLERAESKSKASRKKVPMKGKRVKKKQMNTDNIADKTVTEDGE